MSGRNDFSVQRHCRLSIFPGFMEALPFPISQYRHAGDGYNHDVCRMNSLPGRLRAKEKIMNTCLCYSRCTTCKKALKWLDDHHVEYAVRPIVEEKPTAEELKAWSNLSGKDLRKFFNTSGKLYREMGLSKKVGTMTPDEMLSILSTDGMLVKRPLLVTGSTVLVGFKEAEWQAALLSENKQ